MKHRHVFVAVMTNLLTSMIHNIVVIEMAADASRVNISSKIS